MNLRAIRTGLLSFTSVMLALGYSASQWFFFNGRAADYARIVDTPTMHMLSLTLLVSFIGLWFAPDREREA